MKLAEIYNFGKLEEELERLADKLMTACDDLRAAGKNWATKENDYRRAKAIAYLNAEGTIDARKAKVDQACDRERLEAHIAEAEREACLEHVRSLRATLSAYQTLARVNQSEMDMAGLPQPRWGNEHHG